MKEYRELILSLTRLDKEEIAISGELGSDFLGLDAGSVVKLARPIEYALQARMISGNVLVSGEVKMSVEGDCGRCLTPVTEEFAFPHIALFFEEIDPKQEELDISDELRTELLLALPVNILCGDDCAGLCPVCGCDLNRESCSCRVETPEIGDASPWDVLDELNE